VTAIADRYQPSVLVNLARSMMRVQRTDLVGTWPRASAILGRQALELALDQLWAEVAPGLEKASRRAQLLCLPEYVESDLANQVRYTWYGLSAACHHHAYELPPVVSELNGWLTEVAALIDEVGRGGKENSDNIKSN